MSEHKEFFCTSCNTQHDISELGSKVIKFGVSYYKCKKAIELSVDADKETHFKVMIDEETTEVGVCKCGANEPLMAGRCWKCHDKIENMKNKARTQPPKEIKLSPPDLMKRYDTIKDVCEASEANMLLAIH